jgi:hypothetical protein
MDNPLSSIAPISYSVCSSPFDTTFHVCDTGVQFQAKFFYCTVLPFLMLQLGRPHINNSVALLHLNLQVCIYLLKFAELHVSIKISVILDDDAEAQKLLFKFFIHVECQVPCIPYS